MSAFGIAQPVRRVEDRRFLTGAGSYIEDIDLPRQAYGVLVLSSHAHARLQRVDKSGAEAAEGVLCVLTGGDLLAEKVGPMFPLMLEDMGGPKGIRTPRFILAHDKVRYAGEPVAFVVAETLAEARDAAELVEVEYDPLPPVVTPDEAVKPGAPQIWDEAAGNVSFTLTMGDAAATEAAFAKAAHRVELRMVNNRLSANSMETRGAIGEYSAADGSYTLYTSTQNPHGTRHVLASQVLHLPETQLRVVARDVGGGFGMKGDTYAEEALVLHAARKIGRPVKWISTRSEGLLTDTHGRDQLITGELALDGGGKILAIRAQGLNALGGAISGVGVIPVLFSLQMIPQAYHVPTLFLSAMGVFTTTAPLGPYRGAGRPEATYFTERLLDQAARQTGIDPVELRRRNFIAPGAMPYTTPTGIT
jgi:carbon-monoxide dehydrogenase large subunit